MPTGRPDFATKMVGAQELHMEILDPSTQNVWQSLEPVTLAEYRAFPLEVGFVKIGIGRGAMDEHWFDRSPGTDISGPMEVREFGGRAFGLCARPATAPELPFGPDGPRRLLVDKHHVMRFAAGRAIPLLVLPDSTEYVHVMDGGVDGPALQVPEGCHLRHVSLREDWIVHLPHPTTVFFFPSRDSFQGPIEV
ncbi:MAG: hypothetical protein OES69_08225 [Myxococcales bacterium]|nr:hypothetical protein [Myxococcales bacterium]MDH3843909.1 hypothetical protein [Myxococcales bacterium]